MIRRALPLIALLTAGCGREREPDPAAAAKTFFAQLTENRLNAAFDESSFFFRHQQTRREFEARVRELGLAECTLAKVDAPAIDRSVAKQSVEIRTGSGAQALLFLTLTRERDRWRIFAVKAPVNIETGLSENYFTHLGKSIEATSIQEQPVPDERAVLAMAKETMLRFHDAIQQRSFEDFYEGVARSWQRQLTLGMLTRTFQGFIDQRTNLIAIKDLDAVLKHPPRIDSEGLLVVAGTYATQPHRIDFELKYFYEMPDWRPFGVTLRMLN